MAQADDCAAAVEKTAQHFGRLDVLVHNAGGPSPGKIEDVSPEQWRQTMDLHVNANYYLARAAGPYLRKNGEGCYITVSSTAGIRGVPGADRLCDRQRGDSAVHPQPGPRLGR